jgi:hypothetical protein
MAIDFKSNINLGKNQLQNALLHPTNTAPSTPAEGQVYFNTTANDKKLYVYDGASWIDVTGDIRTISSGTLNTIAVTNGSGGDTVIELSHLGLEDLAARTGQSADAIFFYDVSAETSAYLTCDTATGIAIDGTSLTLSSIPNASLANSTFQVVGGNGLTGGGSATSLGSSSTLAVGAGTGISVGTDAVAVKGASSLTDDTIVMWDDTNGQFVDTNISQNASTGVVTVDDDLVVTGDLTVQGSLTSIETTNTAITDNVIVLNSGETGAGITSVTSGIEIERGTLGNKTFVYHETNSQWELSGQLKISDIPSISSGVGSFIIQSDDTNETGEIKKMPLADVRDALGVSSMTLTLEASTGTQATGAVWVTKSGNTYTVEHQMGTKFIIAQVYDSTNFSTAFVEIKRNSDNQVQVVFAQSVTDGDYYLSLQATRFQSHGDDGNIQGGGGGQIGG